MNFQTLSGKEVTRIGLGTWMMGDDDTIRDRELDALRAGIEAGANLLDTAEMYGSGRAENLLGEAMASYPREDLYVVSKVYPWNADRENMGDSLKYSLKRLGTDYLDLYLLHWPGQVPLEETIGLFEDFKRQGLIRDWGVSNFDTPEMERLWRLPGGEHCLTNQVLYNIADRGVEFDLLPWMDAREMPLMAYCPLAKGGELDDAMYQSDALRTLCDNRGITIEQLMLAFLLTRERVLPIPKSSSREHTLQNLAALDIRLTADELDTIESVFPKPDQKQLLTVV